MTDLDLAQFDWSRSLAVLREPSLGPLLHCPGCSAQLGHGAPVLVSGRCGHRVCGDCVKLTKVKQYLTANAIGKLSSISLSAVQVCPREGCGLATQPRDYTEDRSMAAVASSLGWAVISASHSFWMLVLGRIVTGFFDCLSVPGGYMYIAEVAETRLKGSFLNSTAVLSGLGIAFGYLFGSSLVWRYSCFVAMMVNMVGIATFFFCYESPVFILMNNQAIQIIRIKVLPNVDAPQSALECLHWYRQLVTESKESQQELERELKELESEASMAGQHSLRRTAASLLQPANLRPFLIVMALFLFYPITGMEAYINNWLLHYKICYYRIGI